jgi:putative heme transporter
VDRKQEDHEKNRHLPSWIPSTRVLIGLAVVAALVVVLLHAQSITHDAGRVLSHFQVTRLPWLGVALLAEMSSFVCYAMVQRGLLAEGGARLSRRDMIALAIAATGLTNLLPGGTAPSSGWLVAQYRKRNIPMPLALWAVMAGGIAAAISVLTLTLVGASIAGLLSPIETAICTVLLVGGSIGFIAAIRRLDALDRWFRSHHFQHFDGVLKKLSKRVGEASQFRAPPSVSAKVLALSLGNWGLDVACLIAAFALLGLPIPWSTVLFAYAFAQIAGSLAPVPGGIGFVEGGMVGAFALAGTPVGGAILATILYRLITSVGVAGVGSVMLLHLSHKKSTKDAELTTKAAALNGETP